MKARAIGDIYTATNDAKEIIGYAVCFPPGHDLSDLPSSEGRVALDEELPEAQRLFRKAVWNHFIDHFNAISLTHPCQFTKLQSDDYAGVYPDNFRKDSQYVYHFAVKDGWRRQGVGSEMIIAIVKEVGHRSSRLSVRILAEHSIQ